LNFGHVEDKHAMLAVMPIEASRRWATSERSMFPVGTSVPWPFAERTGHTEAAALLKKSNEKLKLRQEHRGHLSVILIRGWCAVLQ
jgi:hypothetical protein